MEKLRRENEELRARNAALQGKVRICVIRLDAEREREEMSHYSVGSASERVFFQESEAEELRRRLAELEAANAQHNSETERLRKRLEQLESGAGARGVEEEEVRCR